MPDDRPSCLYCGTRYDTPLPCECPGCGQRLGRTMSPDTTLRDIVSIAARSGSTVLVQATPGVAPGVAGILVSLDDDRGWGAFLRHDGTMPTDEDMAAIEAALPTDTPTPPPPGEE